jgi:hypothetical protein
LLWRAYRALQVRESYGSKKVGKLITLFLSTFAVAAFLIACGNDSNLYLDGSDLLPTDKMAIWVVHDHPVFWAAKLVRVKEGRHKAKAVVGLNKEGMKFSNVSEFETDKIMFKFRRMGLEDPESIVYALEIDYPKKWIYQIQQDKVIGSG